MISFYNCLTNSVKWGLGLSRINRNLNVNCLLIGDKKFVPGNLSPTWVIRRQKWGDKKYQWLPRNLCRRNNLCSSNGLHAIKAFQLWWLPRKPDRLSEPVMLLEYLKHFLMLWHHACRSISTVEKIAKWTFFRILQVLLVRPYWSR